MQNKIAVILVNWNSFDLTSDCIQSLCEMNTTAAFDILVTDNGSADGSGDRLQQTHPSIILLRAGSNLGFTGGNNLGMQYAIKQGYPYILLLNNDTFSGPGLLDHLVQYMDAHPETGAIQPKIYFHHDQYLLWNGGTGFNSWLGHTYTLGYNKPDGDRYNTLKEVPWITGCAFFTRKEVLEQSGLLAENLFIYYEDTDLSFRIKQAGYRLVYYPFACIYHIAGMANKSKTKGKEGFVNPVVHYLNQRNRIWLLKKYTPWYCIPTVLLFNFLYSSAIMVYFVCRLRFRKLHALLRGIRDGIRQEMTYPVKK